MFCVVGNQSATEKKPMAVRFAEKAFGATFRKSLVGQS
jgi:hypothetical protein